VVGKDKLELLTSSKKYSIIHPEDIITMEMSKKEIRKLLK
jgi:hypothetical protein